MKTYLVQFVAESPTVLCHVEVEAENQEDALVKAEEKLSTIVPDAYIWDTEDLEWEPTGDVEEIE